MSDRAAAGWDSSRSAAGDRNPWLVAIVVSIATFMVVLDTAIANVSLRYIAGSLAASVDESTWVVTTYLIANAVVLPASGWLSNVIGRKRFYMLCVALFTVSSLLCGLAPSLGALIFFRILQGLGGGGMPTSEQAILADTFPPQKRGQAFALYGVAVIVAPTVGPTIGGWITDNFSWHWIFFINVPIGLISLALVHWLVDEPETLERERRERLAGGLKVDWVGFALIAIKAKPTQSTFRPPAKRSRRSRSSVSGSSTSQCTSASETSPIGTLMKKIQCQEKLSVIQPPIVGPMVGATITATP